MSARLLRGVTMAVAAWLVAGCGGVGSDPVAGQEFAGMDADYIVIDLRQVLSTEGVRRGVVLGDTAYVYEDSGKQELIKVDVTLYHEHGEQSGSLTAERGEVDSNTDAMIARGNVVRITEDGRRVETEELHYDPQLDRVWSDVATTLHQRDGVIHGTGFTSDANLQTIRVTQPTGRVEGLERDTP
jgi:LPS export ABC transporter protein LptC